MNVLRITRHQTTQEQIEELKRIYGENTNVFQHPPNDALRNLNVEEIKRLIKTYSADVVEAMLPLALLAQVVGQIGVPVIRASLTRDKRGGTTRYHLNYYEEVIRVEVETKRL